MRHEADHAEANRQNCQNSVIVLPVVLILSRKHVFSRTQTEKTEIAQDMAWPETVAFRGSKIPCCQSGFRASPSKPKIPSKPSVRGKTLTDTRFGSFSEKYSEIKLKSRRKDAILHDLNI